MGKYKDIDAFIDSLKNWDHTKIKELKNLDIINMYNDDVEYGKFLKEKYSEIKNICLDNWSGKAQKKQENLRLYLERMKELNPSRLFVGEAPGIGGCYRTGIPFTSESIISKEQTSMAFSWYFKDLQMHYEKKESEPTSTVVWGCLDHLGCLDQICKQNSELPQKKRDKSLLKEVKLPLLWNIYPFQPLKDKKEEMNTKNNRTPKDIECDIGIKFLYDLLKCFNIKEIYPVGGQAGKTLPLIGKSLRHPSSGGTKEFRRQFNEIYQIESEEPKNQKNKKKNKKDQKSET